MEQSENAAAELKGVGRTGEEKDFAPRVQKQKNRSVGIERQRRVKSLHM